MASLKKIKTKGGEVRYRVQYRVDGRVVEKWHRTFEAARAEKTRAESDALDGLAIDPRRGNKVLNAYFDGWIDARLVKGRALTPATKVGYRRLWTRNVADKIGKHQLRSIRPDTVRKWHGELAATSGADQAAKSYRLVRAVLATAEADELIRSNPCKIRGGGQEQHAERPLIETAMALNLADKIDARYRALVLLAGFGGLRTGENLGLRRCDVDLLHRQVRVAVQAQEIGGRITLEPKSEAGRRQVAVPAIVVDALDAHLRDFTDPDPEAPVFTGPEGGPLRRATLSVAWRAAVKAAGAPAGLRLHDLRHHAATLTARTPGVTTKELMARIGHSTPRAALIYQHATEERDRAVADYLDSVVAAAKPTPLASITELA